jgi:CP family cyanate transporter-like MFS transporter
VRTRAAWAPLALLWCAGLSVRVLLLSVAPLLPRIHSDLHLDETEIGVLTGLPVVLFATTTVLGSLLIARLGARRALVAGLLVAAAGGAARGAGGGAALLFAMTVVMGLGIAVSQPALPSAAQLWCAGRTGLATAVYSNGMLVGEIAAASLTAPLLLSLVGGWWRPALSVWALPVAATALAVATATPPEAPRRDASPARWWPDWRSTRTWRLGLILGCASITYFGSNTFIPEYLKARGEAALIAPALTSLNLLQLPASFLVAALPGRLIGRRAPLLAAGALILAGVVGLLATDGWWVVLWAGILGFAAGLVFVLSLALPPLLSAAGDVHRLSAAMFTITYLCGFLGGLCGGALWDLTGMPATAFAPLLGASALMAVLAWGLSL